MYQKRRNRFIAALLSMLLVLYMLPLNVQAATDEEVKLTIIHTNDRHGRTQADAYISQIAKELKDENVLILDAGDTLHGQTAANLSKGEAMVGIMNSVGYSAMVPGNHDFNYGLDRLIELSDVMDFPLLAANVKAEDGKDLFQAYEIFEMDGIKVGVFGLASPETVELSDPRIVKGIVFEDPVDVAEEVVATLEENECDVIIALVHMGLNDSSDSANKSEVLASVAGIDVIIDGHSHTVLENGKTVGDALIAQTGEFGWNIGIVELTVKNGDVSAKARLESIPSADDEDAVLKADETIIKMIAAEEAKIEPITSEVVGYTPVLLEGARESVRTSETNLADLITDSMLYVTNSDISFLTGGNIRASIESGDITMGDVLNTMPYSNLVTTVELSGKDVLEMLEHGVSLYPEESGQYIQVSGIHFEFDAEAEPMNRVTKVTMADGSAFDANKTYVVASIEFLTEGGDGYSMMLNGQNKTFYQGDTEVFVEYLTTEPTISAEPDSRVVAVTKAVEETKPVEDTKPIEENENPEAEYYIVKQGDYLVKIASLYNTTWRELQRINNISNPNLIYPGQKILLPAKVSKAA